MRALGILLIAGLVFGTFASFAAGEINVRVENSGKLEHVEIRSAVPVDLTGWTLSSAVGDQSLRFESGRVAAGGMVRVVSGTTVATAGDLRWTTRNVWNNDGDVAMLFDPQGTLVAEHQYGRVKAKSPAKASSAKGARTRP